MSEVSASGRSYLASEFRGGGQVETPCVRGQGRQLGGDTPSLRPVAASWRRDPASEVRGGGREELSRVRGRGSREKPPRARGQGQ